MSLLDDEESYDDEEVLRSHTDDLLFDTSAKSKAKRSEKRTSKAWAKQKENIVQEKTPKKSKTHSNTKSSSNSKTPPDSPKAVRSSEVKPAKGVASQQLQPSPNVKNQRKRYSMLGEHSDDEDSREGGMLVSNNSALLLTGDGGGGPFNTAPPPGLVQQQQSSNPFLCEEPNTDLFFTPSASSMMVNPLFPMNTTTQQRQSEPWLLAPTPAAATAPGNTASAWQAFTPSPQHLSQQPPIQTHSQPPSLQPPPVQPTTGQPLVARAMESSGVNPMWLVQEGEQTQGTQDFMETNPFLMATPITATSSLPTNLLPPMAAAPPPSLPQEMGPTHTSTQEVGPAHVAALPEEDWSISEDLRSKCIQQFLELEPVQGLLQGDKARKFFIQSKLPSPELSAIW